MKPAYITCIKDEPDLIYYNLVYYYNIGIRNFYVMFNNSGEETIKEVEIFRNAFQVKMNYFYDDRIGYHQPERFTMMANEAYKKKCDWIIPVDADEIIVLTRHKKIQDYLKCFEPVNHGFIQCRWIDFHPGDFKGEIKNYFIDWKYRERNKRQTGKILLKWSPDMYFGDGHHLITKGRKKIAVSKVAYFAHFPNRSYDQLKRKIEIIGKAFVDYFGTDCGRPQIESYKEMNQKGEQFFIDKWNSIEERRKRITLIYDPINPALFE